MVTVAAQSALNTNTKTITMIDEEHQQQQQLQQAKQIHAEIVELESVIQQVINRIQSASTYIEF